jgi:hypothetical protein
MKKVKFKMSYEEAVALLDVLNYGEKIIDSNDVIFAAMCEALLHEVINKLTIATIYHFSKPKTFTLSVAQALSVVVVKNPHKDNPYFEYVISQKTKQMILQQISVSSNLYL